MTYVLTQELQANYWKVSRSTLHSLRVKKILIEGIHWVISGNKVYYNTEIIEHGLANGFDSFAHLQKCQQYRKRLS